MVGQFKDSQVLLITFLIVLLSTSSQGFGKSSNELTDDFVVDSHQLKGTWTGVEKWKGTLCPSSYYQYRVDLKANLSTIDFELNENESIDVYVDLYDLWAYMSGKYRSSKTVCVPFASSLWVGVDRSEIYSQVTFTGSGESLSDINVRVIATRLGTVRLGKYVPSYVGKQITKILNYALAKLWASKLGGWISEKVTELIRKNIPANKLEVPQDGLNRLREYYWTY